MLKRISEIGALVAGLCLWDFFGAYGLCAETLRAQSVQEAVRDSAENGIPVHLGETLTLVGVLTSDPTILGAEACVTHLQDATAGIQLFTTHPAQLVGQFQRGDLVKVQGKLKQYKGMDELLIEDIHRLGAGKIPDPRNVQASELNSRHYMGQLARATGQLSVPADFQYGRSCQLRDSSGEITIYLAPKFFQNPKFVARLVEGGSVKVVGIAGQAKDQPPYDSGFRLAPRDTDDFSFGFVPPYRAIAAFLAVVLVFGILLDLWVRRGSAEHRAREMAIHAESLKQSEEALRLSEEKFAKAFQSSPDVMAISTLAEGLYIDVNDGFLRLSGYQRDEVIGHTVTELNVWINPAQRSALVQTLRESGRVRNLEAEFRMKSGEVRVGLISAEVINLSGRACMLSVVRDITERKEAEKKLAERTTYLNALMENSPLGIVVHDTQDRVQMCNPAFERLFLYRETEIAGAKLDDLIRTNEKPSEADEITRRVLGGETVHVTTRRRRKDGTLVDVELYGVPLIVHGVAVAAYGLYQDITNRVALEDQLRQAQKMEAVGRLAGGVAHDFNNILMVIKGHGELLRERVDSDDPRRRNIEQIQEAADRAASLTQQLLAYSRKQMIEPKVLDLNGVVADMGKMLPRLLGEDISLVIAPGLGLGRVKADRGQMEQVLLNLAANARDAMPGGGKLSIETVNVELGEEYARHHAGLRSGRYVMMAVSDTGCGMDAETQSHIFEPFFTTKERGKGTGLGLATVFGIVKQNDGHIWVYSHPGRGTTFKVYLPRVEEAVEESRMEGLFSAPLQGSETILLVEDEDAVRELVRESLQASGYKVLEASSGAEAIELSERHSGPIDLMVTDVVMPGMSGRDLAQRLAPRRPSMKVLYVSGYTEAAIAQHGVLDPGTAFLQKPFRPADLARKISKVLGSGKPAMAEPQRT